MNNKQIKASAIEGNSELKSQMIEANKEANKNETEDRKSARTHDAAKYISTLSKESPKFAWYLFTIVDTLRGLVRPIVTFWVVGLFTVFILCPDEETSNLLLTNGKDIQDIKNALIGVLFACIAFWFGDKVAEGIEKKK